MVVNSLAVGVEGYLALSSRLSNADLKAVRNYQKRIKEHELKLKQYKANPDAYDNKGTLANEPEHLRTKIIAGRVKYLEKDIQNFKQYQRYS